MQKLTETKLQKVILFAGGVLVFLRLVFVQYRNAYPSLLQAVGISILTLVLLIIVKGYTLKFGWIIRHEKSIVYVVALLVILLVGYSGYAFYRFHKAERNYQNCLDKVAQTSQWVRRPSVAEHSPLDVYFGNIFDDASFEQNEYFDAWIKDGRPYYTQGKGYWEVAFMKWMMKNHADYCKEYLPNEISFFLERKVIDR